MTESGRGTLSNLPDDAVAGHASKTPNLVHKSAEGREGGRDGGEGGEGGREGGRKEGRERREGVHLVQMCV